MKRNLKILLSLVSSFFLIVLLLVCVSAKGNSVKPEAPKMKSVSNAKQGLCVSWKKVSNAEGYIVYRLRDGSEKWKRLGEVGSGKTLFIDKTVKHATTYKYVVKSFIGDLKSSQSPNPKSKMYVAAPKKITVKNVRTGIKLKWKKTNDASAFSVYRKINGSDNWKRLAVLSGKTNSFIDSKVISGEKYSYQVRRSIGEVMSARDANIVTKRYVAAPSGLTANENLGSVSLSWKGVLNAKGYNVYRKAQGSSWKQIGTTHSVSFYDKNVPAGKYVYYKVCAYINSKSVSGFSKAVFSKLVDPKKPMVALTYDDGPYRPVTNQILDVLEKYGARATFFVVGSRVSTYSDCIRRANSLGCQIGNHTYNHTTLTEASDLQVISEISTTNDVIKKCIGKKATIVRAPGGSLSSRVRSLVDYPLINWSVDTLDWKHRNTAKIIGNVKSNVTDGSIVLMHDLYSSTGNAAEVIVPWLINQGYQLVTVSEMMYYKDIRMSKGNVYSHA